MGGSVVSKSKMVRLVSGFTIDDVAEACRSAAIEFLDGVRDGWGKRELAAWLIGPYHQLSLLRCSAEELAFSDVFDHTPKPGAVSSRPRRVADRDVDRTMRDARKEVLRVIEQFAAGDPSAETFVWKIGSRGVLASVEDETGMSGVVPNELASQRLVERVLSLIAADYVARPFDYEDRVAICATCKTVTFDEEARALGGDCGGHRESGVRARVDLNQIRFTDSDMNVELAARLRDHVMASLKTGSRGA